MSEWYCFYLKKGVDSLMASYELERCGLQEIAVIEDPGVDEIKILGRIESVQKIQHFSFIEKIESIPIQEINWKDQWELFSPGFKGEKLTFYLNDYIERQEEIPVYLHPGPGFGDLSHPSTLLTIKMMLPLVEGRIVIDVGCGSGVLGIAAIRSGAKRAYAIDIDSQAISHSRGNAVLNLVQDDIVFGITLSASAEVGKYPIVAMNMIASDQILAWEGIKDLSCHQMDIFTSGILALERDRYLCESLERGWELKREEEKGGWLAFYFTYSS